MSLPLTLLAAGLALGSTSALADDDVTANHINGVRLDVHANFGGYGSLGAGFRVEVPLLKNGMLNEVDDELALSVGADAFFYSDFFPDRYNGGVYVIPSAVLQWNFYIGESWSVFPEAGIAFYVGDSRYLRRETSFYAAPAFGLGFRYHFNDRNALLVRVATPTGFQVGVTF